MPLTDLGFLEKGADWTPKSEKDRLDMYERNKDLFESKHDEVFTDLNKLLKEDQDKALDLILNWPKRLSTLWADLLAGDPPTFTVGKKESPLQLQLDAIVQRNQFATLVYDIALDISRYGDGVFKIGLAEGKAVIRGQSPSYWFPVVTLSDIREIQYQVLAWPFEETIKNFWGKDEKIKFIKVEIHERGRITHKVLELGKNGKIEKERDPMEFFDDIPAIEEDTRVDEFLVQQAPGLRPIDRLYGLNDYKDAEGIVKEMEKRLSQISRILDKHSDPTMYGPSAFLVIDRKTGEKRFLGTGKYIPVDDDATPPGYVVWDGQLSEAFNQLEELKQQFWLVTETSPAAFGQVDVGIATSGTALRRLMQAPLAKARRLRMRIDPVAKKVLQTAAKLEYAGAQPVIDFQEEIPETNGKVPASVGANIGQGGANAAV